MRANCSNSAQPQRKTVGPGAQVHPAQSGDLVQRNDIGALLVELHKITAGKPGEGKVGCYDDIPGVKFSVVRDCGGAGQSLNRGVFVNREFLSQGIQELQGMKSCLIGESDAACGCHGQLTAVIPLGGIAQLLQGRELLIQNSWVGQFVHRVALFLKIAGDILSQLTETGQGLEIGVQVPLCLFLAQMVQKLVIDQPVLGCDFCGGISGLAASDLVRLQNHGVNSGLLQLPGRKNSRDTGADHRYIIHFLHPFIQLRK